MFAADSKPTITIIVPVYNSEKTISKCVRSLLNQTYSPISIILVDDGSTDSSLTLCNHFGKKYANISVYNKENRFNTC